MEIWSKRHAPVIKPQEFKKHPITMIPGPVLLCCPSPSSPSTACKKKWHLHPRPTSVTNPCRTSRIVMFWLGLAWKPLALAWLWTALASGILRPSHRHWLWPGLGLAWPEPWPERWLCDKSYILQGVKPGASPNTGRVSCSESSIERAPVVYTKL